MQNQNNQKSLSEIFKELERDKEKQVNTYRNNQKEKQETSFIFHVKHRTKKDNVLLVLIVLVVLFIFSLFSRNYIFAVNIDEGPKNAVGTFEKNENPKDVYEILSQNISNTEQKEIFDQEESIEFETEYVLNKDVPDGETKILQEGLLGSKLVTYVRSYQNNTMLEQSSIGERILQEPQKQIIEVGTSKILKQYNIHIGDDLYLAEDIGLKNIPDINSEDLLVIPKYYNVKTLEVICYYCWMKKFIFL